MKFIKHSTIILNGRMRFLYKKATSISQNPVLYIRYHNNYITYKKYKLLSKKRMIGGSGINQEIIDKVLEAREKLNYYYIDKICTNRDVKETIDTYNEIMWKGKKHTVCYITTAALVWLLSGEDKVAPFSGNWEDANITTNYKDYQHCVVAFVIDKVDDIESTLQHSFVSLNNGKIILDSNWSTCQGLTQTTANDNSIINKLKNKAKYIMKYITFNISSEKEIEMRINLVKQYKIKEPHSNENTIDMSEEAIMKRFMDNFNLLSK